MRKCLILILSLILLSPSNMFAKDVQKRSYKQERIAVLGFGGNVEQWIKDTLTNKIESQIADLGRFQLVNRRNIEKAAEELRLGLEGIVDEAQAPSFGRFLSAQTLIVGTVNYCNYNVKWSGNSTKYEAEISVSAKLIQVEHNVISTGIDIAFKSSDKDSSNVAIGKAIDGVVYEFIIKFRAIYRLGAKIIKVEGDEVFINMGASDGIKPDIVFIVYHSGEELTDPQTGESYGKEYKSVGLIKIVSTTTTSSKGKIVKGRYKIHIGDEVEESPGHDLPSAYILASYSVIPVKSSVKNPQFPTEDIVQSEYYGLSLGSDGFDEHAAIEWQLGLLKAGSITGFATDISTKLRINLIPEFLYVYVGGGIGVAFMNQDLPNANVVFSKLQIMTDDHNVGDTVFNFLGSFAVRLKITDVLYPYAEVSWRHYNTMDEWAVDHKTGETDSQGRAKTEKVHIPEQYLPYSSLEVRGPTYRFGLAFYF